MISLISFLKINVKAWRHLKFEMQDIPTAEMLLVGGQLVWGAHLPLRGLAWSTRSLNIEGRIYPYDLWELTLILCKNHLLDWESGRNKRQKSKVEAKINVINLTTYIYNKKPYDNGWPFKIPVNIKKFPSILIFGCKLYKRIHMLEGIWIPTQSYFCRDVSCL